MRSGASYRSRTFNRHRFDLRVKLMLCSNGRRQVVHGRARRRGLQQDAVGLGAHAGGELAGPVRERERQRLGDVPAGQRPIAEMWSKDRRVAVRSTRYSSTHSTTAPSLGRLAGIVLDLPPALTSIS